MALLINVSVLSTTADETVEANDFGNGSDSVND
jgi:hypothetical protein